MREHRGAPDSHCTSMLTMNSPSVGIESTPQSGPARSPAKKFSPIRETPASCTAVMKRSHRGHLVPADPATATRTQLHRSQLVAAAGRCSRAARRRAESSLRRNATLIHTSTLRNEVFGTRKISRELSGINWDLVEAHPGREPYETAQPSPDESNERCTNRHPIPHGGRWRSHGRAHSMVDRVFDLLEHLADDGGSRSLSELTRPPACLCQPFTVSCVR
jgi:hypothetical protein